MNILGLIPARGGSKSIPHKNIVPLGGRPLLVWTAETALKSHAINRVILSTDDREIAAVGNACGLEVPFLRPPEISQDTTPSIEVAIHAVKWLSEQSDWKADIVVLLQPTSPLRKSVNIDEAVELMIEFNAESVVSVIEVPHRFSPYSVMAKEGIWLTEFWKEPVHFDRFRRQEVPILYARNGPAILATRVPVLLARRSFYGDKVAAYIMDENESLDIDTLDDLKLAEWLLSNRKSETN